MEQVEIYQDYTLGLKKIPKWEFYFQNKLNRVSDLELAFQSICPFCDLRISFPETFSCPLIPDKTRASSHSEMEDIRPVYIQKGPTEVQTTFPFLFFQNIFARRKKNSSQGLLSTNIQNFILNEEPREEKHFTPAERAKPKCIPLESEPSSKY
ncbi:hypothetical protein CEXT_355891 [Caerostris extrusa]|uniref:Uncharacterized protein n=1 Tax=Caerostris extrusa TaxID=172846 RepID=A0AAV4PQF6_CAEEX|nr:hypothetical protein CEXT_355891 [Caerostris extrusa]